MTLLSLGDRVLSRFSHRSYSYRETPAFAEICGDLIAIGIVRASAGRSDKEATMAASWQRGSGRLCKSACVTVRKPPSADPQLPRERAVTTDPALSIPQGDV